jgi:hypothetical protein
MDSCRGRGARDGPREVGPRGRFRMEEVHVSQEHWKHVVSYQPYERRERNKGDLPGWSRWSLWANRAEGCFRPLAVTRMYPPRRARPDRDAVKPMKDLQKSACISIECYGWMHSTRRCQFTRAFAEWCGSLAEQAGSSPKESQRSYSDFRQ